jgi:DNA-binding transcriptional ArsR family regulator
MNIEHAATIGGTVSVRTVPQPPATLQATTVLHALADPVRLELVRRLYDERQPIACGTFDAGVAKSTLSHHFRILREAGVIATERQAGRSMNSLRRQELDAAFPGLLRALFDA